MSGPSATPWRRVYEGWNAFWFEKGNSFTIGLFRVLFETSRIMLAKELDLVSTLLDELHAFKMKPARIDPGDPDSWRETENDGLVIATALACWRGRRNVPTPQVDRDRWDDAKKRRNTGGVWGG